MTSPGELRTLARQIAIAAADFVADQRRRPVTVAATKSSPVDVVTQVDRDTEQLIRSLITNARPDDAILGEEEAASAGTSGVRWIVDPIDGTVNFLYGLPQYSVSIAVEADGVVVAGVVVNAAAGTVYSAALGAGADRDGTGLAVRAPAPLAERLVLTGFNYEAETREVQAQAAARLIPQVRDLRRLGSCALDLCHVAEGSADGYVEEGVALWDFAAGALIAAEAGARVVVGTGRGGKTAVVCAPGHGFDAFYTLVSECGFLAQIGE